MEGNHGQGQKRHGHAGFAEVVARKERPNRPVNHTGAQGCLVRRPGLTLAQRSLTTISVLVARGNLGPLREHLEIGLGNGLTQTEICEAILHCSIYAGFPQTVAAMDVAAEVFDAA